MTDTAPKPRPDAWYSALSEEERWEAWDKLCRLPWQAVARWLREEKGVEVSRSALYRFGAWMRPQQSAHRLEQAAVARKESGRLAAAAGAKKEVADAFMALGSEIALRTGNAADAAAWIKMAAALLAAAQKDREIELRAEAQKLEREKFEAAEKRNEAAKAALGDTTLTDEDKLARMKEIFG